MVLEFQKDPWALRADLPMPSSAVCQLCIVTGALIENRHTC